MNDESAEVKSPTGWSAKVRGVNVLVVALIMSCTFFLWWSEEQRAKMYLDNHKTTQKLLDNVISNQAKIIDSVMTSSKEASDHAAIQTYVMTLTQQKREALNLTMPPALRRQILERQ